MAVCKNSGSSRRRGSQPGHAKNPCVNGRVKRRHGNKTCSKTDLIQVGNEFLSYRQIPSAPQIQICNHSLFTRSARHSARDMRSEFSAVQKFSSILAITAKEPPPKKKPLKQWSFYIEQRLKKPLAYLTCLPIRPAISNIETCGLPNTASSFLSALIMRLLAES